MADEEGAIIDIKNNVCQIIRDIKSMLLLELFGKVGGPAVHSGIRFIEKTGIKGVAHGICAALFFELLMGQLNQKSGCFRIEQIGIIQHIRIFFIIGKLHRHDFTIKRGVVINGEFSAAPSGTPMRKPHFIDL